MEVPQSIKIELSYDPAIALLEIYLKDTNGVKRWNTCTPMFIAAMSTIAKLWNAPQCPSKDERIKMWSIYTMEYYSAIRNDKYPPFASTWVELEGIMLSDIIQSEKDKHMVSFIWGNINNSEREYKGREKKCVGNIRKGGRT